MSQKLLDVLTLGHCSHEFSWPRRSADGHYYQVCLHCATAYNYDWKAMRRTKRVDPSAEAETSASPTQLAPGPKTDMGSARAALEIADSAALSRQISDHLVRGYD